MKESKTRFATGFLMGIFLTFIVMSVYNSKQFGRMTDHLTCDQAVELENDRNDE